MAAYSCRADYADFRAYRVGENPCRISGLHRPAGAQGAGWAVSDRTEVLYVSPLKALGNDIQKNLEIPLGEILALAGERGLLMPEIRTAVRTGDTLHAGAAGDVEEASAYSGDHAGVAVHPADGG